MAKCRVSATGSLHQGCLPGQVICGVWVCPSLQKVTHWQESSVSQLLCSLREGSCRGSRGQDQGRFP